MALACFSHRNSLKRARGNPRIDFDPSHNNTILGWSSKQIKRSPTIVSSTKMEHRGSHLKNFLAPCFPWVHHSKKAVQTHRNSAFRMSIALELSCKSTILNDTHVQNIERDLPSSSITLPWALKFSTFTNGFSLSTLYRSLSKSVSPVLLVVEDTNRNIFGAYSSCRLEVSTTFYGSNDCFLFTTHPVFRDFKGSGFNNFFVMGTPEALIFGSDDGTPGLWIDSDLNRGSTESCKTFNNPPLIPDINFIIRGLECWTFG